MLMWPLVKISEGMTSLLKPKGAVAKVEREEILALAGKGGEDGVFSESESRILNNLLHLRQVRTEDIMTPRTVVFSLEEHMTVKEVRELGNEMPFSRIPVYLENPDDVTGFVLKSDMLQCLADGKGETKLSELKRPVSVVLDSSRLTELFERLLEKHLHMAVVVDEYGGVEGLVTMEDLMETLIGLEIVDESDQATDMRELARKKWVERRERHKLDLDDGSEEA